MTDFFPDGYVSDGSISYQTQLQEALDAAGEGGKRIVFPAMIYLITDEAGLKVHSGQTLVLDGARFIFPVDCDEDGQVFRGENVQDVRFIGGEIVGRYDVWPAGVNIRGIYLTGDCQRIRVEKMYLHDLTSNGVGVFGKSEAEPARDVWITDTIIDHCCNVYGDYMAPKGELHGPEKGSQREDQGSVALYYVNSFQVRGCRMDRSRSDGTHFYHCQGGQICRNQINRSKMGGFFLEGCRDVLASDNIILQNGSRGCTIERGSHNCTLNGNLVEESGREGLWIPDSTYCVVTNNIFRRNGRKPNGSEPRQRWNANITINESSHDPSETTATHCVFSGNLIESTKDQIAAIRLNLTEKSRKMVLMNNIFTGERTDVMIEGEGEVIQQGNIPSQQPLIIPAVK
ncbi:MAG: right-handed parallel beta-helix repeat-containing protein [Planctomycetaceae bacterium]|nr:right-handed parallel beta-helix repeat-containing protein [Planctomycetaceae bacterium]